MIQEDSNMAKMIVCSTCGEEIASSAKVCPKCGAKVKKPFYQKAWFWIVVVVVVLGIAAGGGSDENTSDTQQAAATESATTESETTVDEGTTESSEEVSGESSGQAEEVVEEAEEESVSKEFLNAYVKAETYYSMMHMSKAAIYDQLTSEYGEGFGADAATYAVDKLDETADWNDAALQKARTYQDEMAMSSSAIYDQLTSEYGEKFTAEQAQYAIDNL